MPLDFHTSQALTFGVELELMVVNTRDFNLTRGAPDLLARLAKGALPSEVKPEITESMIEINSTVHSRYAQLRDELVRTRDGIVAAAERLNLAVAGGGSHPFHQWSERRIFPTERFLKVQLMFNQEPPRQAPPAKRFNALGVVESAGGSDDGNGGEPAAESPAPAIPARAGVPTVVGAGRARPLAAGATAGAPASIDFSKAGRNDPCPCGSGKKFKKCHGA